MRSQKGFSLVELIIVLAISSLLLAFTAVGINAIRNSQLKDTLSENILNRIRDTRNLALNSRVSKYDENWTWGYVFVIDQESLGNYCIYKWVDSEYNPTDVASLFNGNLEYNLDNNSVGNKLHGLSCSKNPIPEEFLKVSSFSYSNSQINVTQSSPFKYIVFENLTGKAFVYEDNGVSGVKYPNNLSNINIGFNVQGDTNEKNKKYIKIFNESDTLPYIPTN